MKQGLLITGLLLLAGCAQIKDYSEIIAHPAADDLVGSWQSTGPQSKLVSPEVRVTLMVMSDGATLDCRQWQRVIAVPGKLTYNPEGDRWLNITEQGDIYPLTQHGNQLTYEGIMLQKVSKPTPECTQALQASNEKQ